MKIINIIVVFMLVIGGCLAASSGPIEIRSGANITLNGGYIRGVTAGYSSLDVMNMAQGWTKLNKSGGTMTGSLAITGYDVTGINDLTFDAAGSAIDWNDRTFTDLGTITMDGKISSLTNGSLAQDAMTLRQGWDKANKTEALLKTGGTMSGAIAMSNYKITGVLNGTAAQDAVTVSQGWGKANDTYRDPGRTILVGYESWNDFIVTGSVTDELMAAQAVLRSGIVPGGQILLGVGNFTILNGEQMVFESCITLRGMTRNINQYGTFSVATSTIISVLGPSHTPFMFDSVVGCGLSDVGIKYPNQVTNSTPVVYPPTIQITTGVDMVFDNILCDLPYIFFDIGSENTCGRIYLSNIYGYPLYRGVQINNCFDVSHFTHIIFSPNYYNVGSVLRAWVYNNGIAINQIRADALNIDRCFFFGYLRGFVGVYGGAILTGSGFDGCREAIWVVGEGYRISGNSVFAIGNGDIPLYSDDQIGINLLGNASSVSDNSIFSGADGVRVSGKDNIVQGNHIYFGAVSSTSRGILSSGSQNSLLGNTIVGLSSYAEGIYDNGLGNDISHNHIIDCLQRSIVRVSPSNNTVISCNQYKNSAAFLDVSGGASYTEGNMVIV
jgi:hypothetical protein